MSDAKVFISYTQEDLEHAVALEGALRSRGLSVWREQESAYSGRQWPTEIGQALSSNDCVLLLWSSRSAGSEFVEFELKTAEALQKRVIPLLMDETPLPAGLQRSTAIPFGEVTETVEDVLDSMTGLPSSSDQQETAILTRLSEIAPGDAETMAQTAVTMLSETIPGRGTEPGTPTEDVQVGVAARGEMVGREIGSRYQVTRLLGQGGMGAVYQVYDKELDRDVALKVIRSDLAEEEVILQRFKREIQLSSEVTHRNVLRVYDLGEAEGMKFLTMQFVEGEDLTDLIAREGKLPVDRIVKILRQLAQGLAAAHEKNVVHRDLKPANVLISKDDHVFLTDFGLATTQATSGITQLTQAGTVMGTPHYMAPEQVRGEQATTQSDIYALGVMLYEMATGQVPFQGNTIFEIMMQRTQKDPEPARTVNADVPEFLDRIIRNCMARDPAGRYASAEELLEDLEEGAASGQTVMMTQLRMRSLRRKAALLTWKKLALGLALLLLVFAGSWGVYRQIVSDGQEARWAEANRDPVSVLIADFENRTDDQVFNGLLEQTLGTTLEGAAFITTYNRGRARQIADRLREGAGELTEESARLVAQREGIEVVVSGSLSREDGSYVLTTRAVDAITGDEIAADSVRIDERDGVLTGLGPLAADIRRQLGDTTPESAQLAAAETFSASSLEAAQAYARAMELNGAGSYQNAIEIFKDAIGQDSEMGRAYAGLAVAHHNLGQREEADENFELAMANIGRMSERERLRTLGQYFLITGNYSKAADELSSLVEQYPADFSGFANLAMTRFKMRDMEAAQETAARGMKIYPDYFVGRSNLAFYSMYASDFEQAVLEARSLIREDPSFGFNYICLALSQLGRGNFEDAAEVYQELRGLGGLEASYAMMGLGDLALFRGQNQEAVEILQEGIEFDLQNNQVEGVRRKKLALADALLELDRDQEAIAAASEAIEGQEFYPLLYEAALVFLRAGNVERSRAIMNGLLNRVGEEERMYGQLILGELALAEGGVPEAVGAFQEAQRASDTWLGRFGLGRSYFAGELFPEAYSEFEECLKRKGEAASVFLDDVPTFHYFPPVRYFLGRTQEALGSDTAQESYRLFLQMKEGGQVSDRIEEVRRRLSDLGG